MAPKLNYQKNIDALLANKLVAFISLMKEENLSERIKTRCS